MAINEVSCAAAKLPARRAKSARAIGSHAAGAVVFGSDYRALGIVRSLGRNGIRVFVLAGGDDVLAANSRYATLIFPVRDADSVDRPQLLGDLADRFGATGWVLFPTADESAVAVAHHDDALAERFLLTTPPWQTVRGVYDKRLTYELAETVGVPEPHT